MSYLPKYRKKSKVKLKDKVYEVDRIAFEPTGFWYYLKGVNGVYHQSELSDVGC